MQVYTVHVSGCQWLAPREGEIFPLTPERALAAAWFCATCFCTTSNSGVNLSSAGLPQAAQEWGQDLAEMLNPDPTSCSPTCLLTVPPATHPSTTSDWYLLCASSLPSTCPQFHCDSQAWPTLTYSPGDGSGAERPAQLLKLASPTPKLVQKCLMEHLQQYWASARNKFLACAYMCWPKCWLGLCPYSVFFINPAGLTSHKISE